MTFIFTRDLDIIYFHHHTKFGGPKLNAFRDMNFFLVNFGQVTDRRTDRQTVMHKSPPCISTGGLKNKNFVESIRSGLSSRIEQSINEHLIYVYIYGRVFETGLSKSFQRQLNPKMFNLTVIGALLHNWIRVFFPKLDKRANAIIEQNEPAWSVLALCIARIIRTSAECP